MVLSSAERQRRYIARIRAAAAASDTFRNALTKALEANTRLRRDLAAAKRLLLAQAGIQWPAKPRRRRGP
jgi:hypothetical protein